MARDGRSGLRGELWLPVIGRLYHARRPDRQDAQGRAAGRDAGPAADPVRASDQPQSGACHRHRDPASGPRPRRRGHRMRRREFIAALTGAAFAWPISTVAQQNAVIPRIGLLMGSSPTVEASTLDAFRGALEKLGYVDGQTVLIEVRYAMGEPGRFA